MAQRETPEALLKFFQQLSPGETAAEESCELHYGCPCVIHKGKRAAEMLVRIQKAMGLDLRLPPPPAPASSDEPSDAAAESADVDEADPDEITELKIVSPRRSKQAPAGSTPASNSPPHPDSPDANEQAERLAALEAERARTQEILQESEAEIDRLLLQNNELKTENEQFRERLKILYKQVEMLYARNEMSSILDRIEDEGRRRSDKEEAIIAGKATAKSLADSEAKAGPAAEPNPETEAEIAGEGDDNELAILEEDDSDELTLEQEDASSEKEPEELEKARLKPAPHKEANETEADSETSEYNAETETGATPDGSAESETESQADSEAEQKSQS